MNCKVIELFGLPGCGKSTLVNSINSDKIGKFFMYNDYLYFDRKRSRFGKVVDICSFSVKHLSLLSFFIKYRNKGSILLYFKMIRFLSSLEAFLKNVEGLVILDQGLSQYIVSFAYQTSNCENDDVIFRMNMLFRQLWSYHTVYLKVPKEKASSMAKNRGDIYAFDLIEDKSRLSIYEKWESCCNKLYEIELRAFANSTDCITCFDCAENNLVEIIEKVMV